MPIQTRSTIQKDHEVCESKGADQVEQESSETQENENPDRILASPSPSHNGSSTEEACCTGCITLRAEIEEMRKEIKDLKRLYFNFPAEQQQSCTTKENMQMIECLKKNNSSLITAVEALSRQLSSQPPSDGDPMSSEASPEVEIVKQISPRKKAKKKKKKGKNPTDMQSTSDAPRSQVTRVNPVESEAEAGNGNQQKRTTLLIGDSMITRIQGIDLGKAVGHKVIVKAFPGATTKAMNHYLKPNLEFSPSEVILHIGTNDLKNREPKVVVESIVDLARQVEGTCNNATITLSELVCRKDKLNESVKTANKHLVKMCRQNGWKLITHQNISIEGLNKGGIHLNFRGNEQFYKNFKEYLV